MQLIKNVVNHFMSKNFLNNAKQTYLINLLIATMIESNKTYIIESLDLNNSITKSIMIFLNKTLNNFVICIFHIMLYVKCLFF